MLYRQLNQLGVVMAGLIRKGWSARLLKVQLLLAAVRQHVLWVQQLQRMLCMLPPAPPRHRMPLGACPARKQMAACECTKPSL